MVTVPALIPLTTPVLETVAIAVFEEVQGELAWGVVVLVSVALCPIQVLSVPEIVGKGLTVQLAV